MEISFWNPILLFFVLAPCLNTMGPLLSIFYMANSTQKCTNMVNFRLEKGDSLIDFLLFR